jgi:hypothetical protein
MKWKFKPKVVGEGFYEGYILVDFPGFEERNKMLKAMNFDFDQEKGMIPAAKAMELKDKMTKAAIEKIKEVSMRRVECGTEITTIEELDGHPELCGVLDEVAAFVMNGIKLSKN